MALIAVDCRMYGHSGIGSYIRNLLQSAFIVERPGVRYRLLGERRTLCAQDRLAVNPRIEIIDCAAPIYSISEQIDLVRATRSDVDLFWSPHYNIPLGLRKRLVVTIHDVNHLAFAQMLDSAAKRWYARLMYAAVRAKATRILCDSAFSAAELSRYTGIDARRITIAHLGVSPHWRELACPRPERAPYYIYVGNVKPHKNLGRLISAFGTVSAKVPHRHAARVSHSRRCACLALAVRGVRTAAPRGNGVRLSDLGFDCRVAAGSMRECVDVLRSPGREQHRPAPSSCCDRRGSAPRAARQRSRVGKTLRLG
jgi:glycosyltransferase involved in cell wall biosynthesis